MTRARVQRASWAAAVAMMVSVALAACVGIPSGSDVMAGELVTEDESFPFAALPSGPQQDSTQQEILTDFMQAATSPEGSYEIARQFLTPSAAESWKPNESVLIREGGGGMSSTDPETVEYSVSTQASVNSLGVYKEDRDQATQRLVYTFAQVDGQWRINGLADGTVISRDNFEAAFDPHALYFFDPSYRFLIPDVRWFPARSNVPNRIVLALLEGQASWLQQGATLTAFPQGTQLSAAVAVTSGLATVDLSDEVTEMNNLDKARMQQQLESSLGTVSVNTVLVTVRNVPLTIPDPGASTATLTPPIESDPLVRSGDRFGFATADTFSSVSGISSKVIEVDATAATLARGQTSAAVLGNGGAYLITSTDPPLLVDARPNLIAPSIDTWKYVWSVPSTSAAPLYATGPDSVVHEVVSTLPADASVVSMDVSRDGARVVLYLTTDAGPRLMVASVLRRDGVPTGLGELVDLPVQSDLPIDASWVDDRSVATLAMTEGHEVVNVFELGGPAENLGRADGGVELVGGNGTEQLRVLTAENSILQRRASGWQSTGLTADFLATQQ
ncbi:sporulation and spore germination protein [Glaciihabitans tibetensis]|uniref:Sporulation and spore germination protein n=1 Tax=Glaciihabitans tibetensis TaxID=1266600 RepID=A0A2T0VFG8_9MICO|nr:LpqB family beta-propeller domain-containing protein [Glaciihabitans tibetensis]PRY68945.1 sporulation and spore germination protein [Glaciihabitans tibetensis]